MDLYRALDNPVEPGDCGHEHNNRNPEPVPTFSILPIIPSLRGSQLERPVSTSAIFRITVPSRQNVNPLKGQSGA